MNLQAKLQKAEEALKVAQEAAKAAKTSAYERGVMETEARLTAEVTVVCREYVLKHTIMPLIGQESLRSLI